MELIEGLDDCTVKKNVLDCPPSGLLTRMLQVPVALSVATITNEFEVTLWICVPLKVVPPPPGKVMDTVRPD
jgi:hypothetical protein